MKGMSKTALLVSSLLGVFGHTGGADIFKPIRQADVENARLNGGKARFKQNRRKQTKRKK